MRRRTFGAAAAAFSMMGTAGATARPVRLLTGFAAGGSGDIVARAIAEKMRVSLDQPVLVENRPGAGGRIMMSELRRAPADGLTIGLVPSSMLCIAPWLYAPAALGWDPVQDFAPIAGVASFDFALTAGPHVPRGDLRAVLDWMKRNPEHANYADLGPGTTLHLTGVLLSRTSGVPMVNVSYKGAAAALQDLLGGRVSLMIESPGNTLEIHRSGKARIIAVTGSRRLPMLPEVPTLREQGIDVVADAYYAIYGPAGLAPTERGRLADAVNDSLASAEARAKLAQFTWLAAPRTPAQLVAVQQEHLRRWESPVKDSGVKGQ